MLREKKTRVIEQLADDLSRCAIVISTSYQGLSAKEMTVLHRVMSDAELNYRVVKNTLAILAARKVDREQLQEIIEGPVALAFGYDDVAKAARTISQYFKSAGIDARIKGGLMGERVLSAGEVVALASLPSREVLISRLMAQLQAPGRGLHHVLSAPLRGLCYVLQARAQQLAE